MIDINELRQSLGAVQPEEVGELLDRLEAAESALSNLGVTPDEARDGLARHKALIARLEAAEKAVTEAYQRGYETGQEELAAELEFAKREVANLHDDISEWMDKCGALRARIAEMEQQEPVAFGLYSGWALKATYLKEHEACEQRDRRQLTADLGGSLEAYRVSPLYALPGAQPELNLSDPAVQKRLAAQWGYVQKPHPDCDSGCMFQCAQPAPSVPEVTWLPVPDKHPTFDPVDLQLADGSVLCGCVPQSDGDYWWEGPSGEVFIDPRYAPVTHWRLAAAPEVKP